MRVVAAPGGVPHAVVVGGRRRAVVAVREDWLVQDRWWTDEPIDRHYFDLLLDPGRTLVVFRDARSGAWLTHEEEPTRRRRRVQLDEPHRAIERVHLDGTLRPIGRERPR